VIDFIEYENLYYYPNKPSRGVFDWNLKYQLLPRLPTETYEELKPFHTPIMNGGVYAIHKKYFFELGPYDEGFIVYGSENIEMSLKVWLCGGEILEVSCSRLGHLFRKFNKFRAHGNVTDYEGYNKKRLIEVWFENYKKFVEMREPDRYKNLNVGDLSKALEYKKIYNCKPFEYFLNEIAPDLEENFPTIVTVFASGTVRLFNTTDCWDTFSEPVGSQIHLFECDEDKVHPRDTQYFEMNYYRDLRNREGCVDAVEVRTRECHFQFGNQHFQYNQVGFGGSQDYL
jgi:polypeptide N-acetylgalactosaminyltransferase